MDMFSRLRILLLYTTYTGCWGLNDYLDGMTNYYMTTILCMVEGLKIISYNLWTKITCKKPTTTWFPQHPHSEFSNLTMVTCKTPLHALTLNIGSYYWSMYIVWVCMCVCVDVRKKGDNNITKKKSFWTRNVHESTTFFLSEIRLSLNEMKRKKCHCNFEWYLNLWEELIIPTIRANEWTERCPPKHS